MTINYKPELEELLAPKGVVALAPEIFNLNTLAYWRHIGTGPRWGKLGRRVVYTRSSVLAWIEEQFNEQVSA